MILITSSIAMQNLWIVVEFKSTYLASHRLLMDYYYYSRHVSKLPLSSISTKYLTPLRVQLTLNWVESHTFSFRLVYPWKPHPLSLVAASRFRRLLTKQCEYVIWILLNVSECIILRRSKVLQLWFCITVHLSVCKFSVCRKWI